MQNTVALDIFHFDNSRPNFEDLSEDNGIHFWLASKLMEALGYSDMVNIKNAKPLQRALTACNTLGIPVQENFEFLEDDVKLTRFACYLFGSDKRGCQETRSSGCASLFCGIGGSIQQICAG